MTYDVVVLAGGRAERLGGVDKPAITVGGRTLLDRVLDAAAGAARRVVVGPRRPTPHEVTWCREEPPGGGPLAAVSAGARHTSAPVVAVLAADLPFLTTSALDALTGTAARAGAAAYADPDGRLQPLAAAFRRALLVERLQALGDPAGQAARRLLEGVDVTPLPDPSGTTADCDTWPEVRDARARAREEAGRAG